MQDKMLRDILEWRDSGTPDQDGSGSRPTGLPNVSMWSVNFWHTVFLLREAL